MEIQGTVHGNTMNLDLLLPIITDTVGLIQKVYINRGLRWIEGSLDPHKAEGHHGPSHISPMMEVALGEKRDWLAKRMPIYPTDFSA